jgi:hypothetical protein
VPASARTKLRLVELSATSLIGSIVEWVWSKDSPDAIFSQVRDELPSFGEEDESALLDRVDELSDTVAALTGLDLMTEVYDALDQQETDGIPAEDFEGPDIEGSFGDDDGWMLDSIAGANMQSGYGAGKVDEDEDTGDWWEYVTQPGACELCAPLDGVQAPQDDGVWADRIPPLHPNCVCDLKAIAPQKIQATEHDVPNESRGTKGFGDPRKRFDPDLSDKPAALLPAYHQKLSNRRRSE